MVRRLSLQRECQDAKPLIFQHSNKSLPLLSTLNHDTASPMRILLFPLLFVLSCADGQAEEKCEAFQLAVCDALDNNCDLEDFNLETRF